MTAEQMMKEYKSMKRELQVLEFQVSQFQGVSENDIIETMCHGNHDNTEWVQTSGTSDKTASVALKYKNVMERENDEWFDFLWSRYQHIKEELDFFEECLKFLPDDMGNIMMDLINRVSWDEIAEKYYVSRTTIQNRRDRAMKELNECYRLRDMQIESFMLS